MERPTRRCSQPSRPRRVATLRNERNGCSSGRRNPCSRRIPLSSRLFQILFEDLDFYNDDVKQTLLSYIDKYIKYKKISSDEWDNQMNTNLRGSFLMTRYITESMISRKTGKLVFINSVAGINPYPYSSAYVASKFGLRGFTSSLREELREYNIKVISIHPGAINTPLWDNVKSNFPRSEMMNVKEVASSVMHTIQQNKIGAIEEIVIRRVKGDF